MSLWEDGKHAGVKVEVGTLKKLRQPFFEVDDFSSDSDETGTASSYTASTAASVDNLPSES
jgi:hypothetical protein